MKNLLASHIVEHVVELGKLFSNSANRHEPYVCYILGITTSWILLPVWMGLQLDDIRDPLGYALSAGHVVVYVASNLHWMKHEKYSLRAWSDTIASSVVISMLVCRIVIESHKIVRVVSCVLLILAATFYKISVNVRYNGSNDLGMWFHALFRVFVFWFSFIVMSPSAVAGMNLCLVIPGLNFAYFGHIYITRMLTRKKLNCVTRHALFGGNLRIAVLIGVCGRLLLISRV